MPFPWTLQRYILRDMGKTFALTALALTGVLGLGGGVVQMIKLGEVTPAQLGRLMLLMLPVAAALTLPIAALFSAAATYGRLSADNEFVACRSSGINMHILFVPAIALSLLSAAVTFAFSNFVIPGMVRNIEAFLADDLVSFVRERLDRPRGITLGGGFRIRAESSEVDPNDPNLIIAHGIRFMEVKDDAWVRYGTAKEAIVRFTREGNRPTVQGVMRGLSIVDRSGAPKINEHAELVILPNSLPRTLAPKLKFLRLGALLRLWRHPGEWHEVQASMAKLRLVVGQQRLFDDLWRQWREHGSIELAGEGYRTVVTSATGVLLPAAAGIELQDVTIQETTNGRTREVDAARAVIEVSRGRSLAECGLQIEAYEAQLHDQPANPRGGASDPSGGAEWINRDKISFGPWPLAPTRLDEINALTDDEVLAVAAAPADPLTAGGIMARRRAETLDVRERTARRVVATVNERTAFSISVVVLVILGAVLGIVFRGSHVMVAFGISFVPSLLIITAIVAGKQMTYNAPTYALGLAVMWGGILLVVGLDVWMLQRVLRR